MASSPDLISGVQGNRQVEPSIDEINARLDEQEVASQLRWQRMRKDLPRVINMAAANEAARNRGETPAPLHIDERTGRAIIQTGVDRDTGLPTASFAPVEPSEVIIPYDQ